ncbi:MAG: matrixin family metalloprotease [Kofleriaceae bacterium]|nr:matrixin family metalloprotease [Kofleriaceae bacterium]
MRSGVVLTSLLLVKLASAGATPAVDAIRQSVVPCDRARTYCFAIHLHVAAAPSGADGLVVAPDWVARQVATANAHFARLDVAFQIERVTALPVEAAHLRTRKERSALGTRTSKRVIDVFITGQLDDVDAPGEIARGVTWRNGTRKFIIVSAVARDLVLAHELGHYFGLPHSTYPISLMNKTKRDAPPLEERTFHDDEYAKMGPVLRRFVETKVLTNRR